MGTTFARVLGKLSRAFDEDIAMDVLARYIARYPVEADGKIPEHGMGYFWRCAVNREREIYRRTRLVKCYAEVWVGGIPANQVTREELRQCAARAHPCLLEWAMENYGSERSPRGKAMSSGVKAQRFRSIRKLKQSMGLN